MVNWWPPAYVRYTDNLLPNVGGTAIGPYVRIRPKYKADVGIHKHELKHVEVFWLTLGLSLVLRYSRRFRLWNEARAYVEQTKWPDADGHHLTVEEAAVLMITGDRYNLRMTQAEVLAYLKGIA